MYRSVFGCLGVVAFAALCLFMGHWTGKQAGRTAAEAHLMPKIIKAAYLLPDENEFANDWAQGNFKELTQKFGSPQHVRVTEITVEGGKGHATVVVGRNGVEHEELVTFGADRVELVESN